MEPGTPAMALPEPPNAQDLDISKQLDGAWTSIGAAKQGMGKYQDSRLRKVVDKSGDTLNTLQGDVTTAQSYQTSAQTVYESDAMKVVRDGVNSFIDSLPGLVKALDEVAKLHPFIGIAVSAFRVVIELDMKRRDNDKKIGVLFAEMKDMMEALLQLRSVKDEETIGPDGMTIKARMQSLINNTTEDIKRCANACDAYSKKKLIVKVIKGSVWETTLKGFIDLFASRRKAFTFALSIHIGVGVDDANRKLKVIDEKIDLVLEFFANIVSPEQQELAALVAKKGGATAVMGSNEALSELLKFKPALSTSAGKHTDRGAAEHNKHQDAVDELAIVKEELFDTPELTIRKNLEVFERKFKMQQRELAEEMRRMVHHEGDRVIQAVTGGPHERIIDPDIHEIWREMRWPGHVKARHFVLALRDYFRQQMEINQKRKVDADGPMSRLNSQDEWAIEYINLNRVQAIAEAFDDDASGFITIAEVNHFTSSRPKDWSLPHWLAYWAIGWQMTATSYRSKIDDISAKMFAIRSLIHPANRNAVNTYLNTVWTKIKTLTASMVGYSQSDELQERFQSYVDSEEQRLREGLETFRYDIDAMDTLVLLTGPGRIEKYIFPLFYLLSQRHFEIFRISRTTVIHKDELWDAVDTIEYVMDAVLWRYNDLQAVFKQQQFDADQQFKVFASELFDYFHDRQQYWSLKNLRKIEFTDVEYDDAKEDQNVDPSKILNYPSASDDLYTVPNDVLTETDNNADDAVRMILGRWYGFFGANRWPRGCMVTFCFHASADRNAYEASDVAALGTSFTILGGYTIEDDGKVEYRFSITYAARLIKRYFRGALDEDGFTLSGSWGTFWFKRTAPEIIIARPPPEDFKENKIRALWKYALTYSINEARRTMWSWSHFKARRDIRKEYLELLEREVDEISTEDDLERFAVLDRTSTYDDTRMFYVMQDYRQRPKPVHFGIVCDHCENHIYGARVVCMQCGSRFTFDFCDKPECVGSTVPTRDDIEGPHLPTHDFVKIRTDILHDREIGKILRQADVGMARAKTLLERASRAENGAEEPNSSERTKPVRRDSSEMSAANSDDDVPVLTCVSCSTSIARPCWYCIDCPDDANVFVCCQCDDQHGGVSAGDTHKAMHSLIRCSMLTNDDKSEEDEKDSTEKRVVALESQMSALSIQMNRIEKLLETLVAGRAVEES
ncbi:hypothetical protein C8Q80DRAFT_1146274 [Daedaleopsis nitida]|nr:hypothetical protein C8Q80DRAFT_1146274 [Daedaleopsis nitida]